MIFRRHHHRPPTHHPVYYVNSGNELNIRRRCPSISRLRSARLAAPMSKAPRTSGSRPAASASAGIPTGGTGSRTCARSRATVMRTKYAERSTSTASTRSYPRERLTSALSIRQIATRNTSAKRDAVGVSSTPAAWERILCCKAAWK